VVLLLSTVTILAWMSIAVLVLALCRAAAIHDEQN
jgi:hypothetical protein